MSNAIDAMLAELESMDSYESDAEAANIVAQVQAERALDLSAMFPRVPTHVPRPRPTILVPKAETRLPFLSPPPVHRAGIPVLAAAPVKKAKRTPTEVARDKAMKDAEKFAAVEEKARLKAAKDAEKAYMVYQKEQAKIAKAFEKTRAEAIKASEKASKPAKVAAAAAPAAKGKAPTKAVLEAEVLRLRTLLMSRGIPY
jgi:hypothetical protein